MSWTWRYVDADGATIDPALPDLPAPAPSFPTQADAESWVGEEWRALFERGVEAVVLLEDGVEVYGPMSLRPVQ